MVKKIERITIPPYYPNMYVAPLEQTIINNDKGDDFEIVFQPDILALVNDDLKWASVDALTDIFGESNFKILSDVYDMLNGETSDNLSEALLDEDELKYSTLQPTWLMDKSINTWDENAEMQNALIKSRKYLNENYIIQSKVLVFPSEVFGHSENALNKNQKNDYYALKFWEMNLKIKPKLNKKEKNIIQFNDSPLIIFLGIFKLNLLSNTYQLNKVMSNSFNPLYKQINSNFLLTNYPKDDRMYLSVTKWTDSKEKLDMSVLRMAILHYVIEGKAGIVNIDKTTYGMKKI